MSLLAVPATCPRCGNTDPNRMVMKTQTNDRTRSASLLAVQCAACGYEETAVGEMKP
jgi:uncharacterized Zn finger protein